MKLIPSFREKIWGRTRLSPWYPDNDRSIGEVWYLAAGRDLPLLVKMIFTSERLSVQVHPADGECAPRGKTEMWRILDAEPGSQIALGFREPITRERARETAVSGEIERLLNWIEVKAGETYFTPAHTVHAIGAGITLFEIQQNCDVTYRLYDYGRPRELHLDQGLEVADLGRHPGAAPNGRVVSPYFVTEPVRLEAGEKRSVERRDCHLWMCAGGSGTIDGERFARSDVWWVEEEALISAATEMSLLRTYVPAA